MGSYALTGRQDQLSFVPYMGMAFHPHNHSWINGMRIGVIGGYVYSRASNWSHLFKATMLFESMSSHYNTNPVFCKSGLGNFMFARGILLDLDGMNILFMRVVNKHTEGVSWLVSDMFDTPKCPIKYKNIRVHWRRYMIEMINADSKICKVSNEFLQKFKSTYNYSPNGTEIVDLKHSIKEAVDSRI